jgi:flagellin-specific chaperone FliS
MTDTILTLCFAAIGIMSAITFWLDREHARAIAENRQAKCRLYRAYIERLLAQSIAQQVELIELRRHRAKRLAAIRKYERKAKAKRQAQEGGQ